MSNLWPSNNRDFSVHSFHNSQFFQNQTVNHGIWEEKLGVQILFNNSGIILVSVEKLMEFDQMFIGMQT